MFTKRVNSLTRNMAVLVCVAFISVLFPEVTHAASQPFSSKPPLLKNSLSSLSPFLFSVNPIFTIIPFNPVTVNILSPVDKKPVDNPANTQGDNKSSDQEDKKDKKSYNDHGNSTSTRPANGKD